jgi:hypothetical protein
MEDVPSRREGFDQLILGQLRAIQNLVSNSNETSLQLPARSADGRSWLSLPRTGLSQPRIARKVALARQRVQRRRPRVLGIGFWQTAIKPPK